MQFFYLILCLGLIAVRAAMLGAALYFYWGWFGAPLLGSFAIPYLTCVAASLCIVLFKAHRPLSEVNDPVGSFIVNSVLIPCSFIGMGWVLHQFA